MFYIREILLVFLLAVTGCTFSSHMGNPNLVPSENENSNMWIFHLPNTTAPLNYTLRIVPFLQSEDSYFRGNVRLFVRIFRNTSEILLHSKDLYIRSVYMGCAATFKLDSANEILRIEACKKLVANTTLEMIIIYEGYIRNNTKGFYLSSYKVGSENKAILATQFGPTFARMVFPCYDEPKYKARFILYIARHRNQSSISNMPLNGTEYDFRISPMVWDRYGSTPPMATYVLAFAVFEYQCEDNVDQIRTCTRQNAIGDAHYVGSVAGKIRNFMENYTDTVYPLPHLQLMSVPDHAANAMENWGLITFKESRMLFNDEVGSGKDLELVTLAVCHEIAEQWFGDYVTPAWWDHIWLNEGFSTFFKFYLMDQLNPSWRMKDYAVVRTLQQALFVDTVHIHRPLTVSTNSPKEIESIFDAITYRKGASILRMLEHMVTTEVFKKSLKQYLKVGWRDYSGTVTPEILWTIFDQKVNESQKLIHSTVSKIMNQWTSNSGYPIVQISKIAPRHTIAAEQAPFKSPRSSKQSKSTAEWIIPLTYTRESAPDFNNTAPAFWLLPTSDGPSVLNELLPHDQWIIFNIQATGYYRVNYYPENWELLTNQLHEQHEKIHVLNRAQLIDDSISLAIDDYLSFKVPFKLMKYLDKERDLVPWSSALNKFDYLYTLYEPTEAGPLLKKYQLERLSNLYQRLDFVSKPNDDHNTRTGRAAIIEAACKLEMKACVEESVLKYHKHSVNLSRMNPDVKKAVLCTAVNSLKREPVWINLWNTYRRSNVALEKETILYTLGCTNDEELLKRYLFKLAHEHDFEIKKQDHIHVLRAVLNREKGVNAGLQLITQLLPSIMYGIVSSQTINAMIEILNFMKPIISTEKQVTMVENLITESEQWDEGVPKNFMNALHSVHEAGSKQLLYRNKRLGDLIEALAPEITPPVDHSAGYSVMQNFLSLLPMLMIIGQLRFANCLLNFA